MTIKNMMCTAIPLDARLSEFDILKPIHVEFIWNVDDNKYNIKFLSECIFVLHKYNCKIIIRPGFICDGGTIPRISWTATSDPYSTRCFLGFILHDALYCTRYFTRAECDWILLELHKELGVDWFTRNKIWIAVKAAGGLCAWSKHTEQTIATSRSFVLKEEILNA